MVFLRFSRNLSEPKPLAWQRTGRPSSSTSRPNRYDDGPSRGIRWCGQGVSNRRRTLKHLWRLYIDNLRMHTKEGCWHVTVILVSKIVWVCLSTTARSWSCWPCSGACLLDGPTWGPCWAGSAGTVAHGPKDALMFESRDETRKRTIKLGFFMLHVVSPHLPSGKLTYII